MRYRLAATVALLTISACADRDPADADVTRSTNAASAAAVGTMSPVATEICRRTSSSSWFHAIYARTACEPIWIDGTDLTASGRMLVDRLERVWAMDRSAVAAGDAVKAAQNAVAAARQRGELDLELSSAFAAFAIDPDNPAAAPNPTRLALLAGQAADSPELLRRMIPADPQIRRLRRAIAAHREHGPSDRWPSVPTGPAMKLGTDDTRTAMLRARLRAMGDLQDDSGDAETFDQELDAAVRRFQARHGLEADGIVGKETLAALNVPASSRLATLSHSLQRLVQQQRDWGARYLSVNIAAAGLTLVEDGRVALRRRAIVGRPTWRTPRLEGVIDRLELHPGWVVPANIARLEVLPKIRKDPGYLNRNNMRIVGGQIRQAPGPGNPLGKVKFIFDNPYSVYLHDTNAPELFKRPARFLSHGCIRVEQALDLARRLLQGDADWPEPRIAEAIAAGRTLRIELKRPIALHIVYDTAWVDEDGIVNFRDDVYGLDRATDIAGNADTAASGACGGYRQES